MCILESFCWLEVRAHIENGFPLKSFALIYACIQESYFCMMLNKIDRPNMTPRVLAICKLAVYFSVFRPFSRFSLVYEGH